MTKEEILNIMDKISDTDTSWQDNLVFHHRNEYWIKISGNLAIRILSYLRTNDLTKYDLIQILDIDEATCDKIVTGRYNFDLALLMRIEKNLNITIINI